MDERTANVGGRGGKVDYKNLWKNHQEQSKRIRWRTLRLRSKHLVYVPSPFAVDRQISTDISNSVTYLDEAVIVHIFGYACHENDGPWFGYTKGMLQDAPCAHCGQVGIFQNSVWNHICPGVYDGKKLPCQDDHACRGEPSMSTAPMWRSGDWIEVQLGSVGG